MFIKIDNKNYYVNPSNKSVENIYYEVFSRMDEKYISNKRKRSILSLIIKELRNHEQKTSA